MPTPIAASFAPVLDQVNVTATEPESLGHPIEVLFLGENEVNTGPVVTGGAALGLELGVLLGLGLGLALGVSLGLALGVSLLLAEGLANGGDDGELKPRVISTVTSTTTATRSRPPIIERARISFFDFSGASPGPSTGSGC